MSDKNSEKFLSQVVIRHLPPTMTGEQFMNEISPVPAHNYFHFLKADLSLGQWAFTRACINFIRKDDIFIFKDKFDGYVFLDSNGTEYPAIVEFSPYQKTPRRRINSKGEPLTCKQRDPKCGTITDDQDFKNFMENLNTAESEKNPASVEGYLVEIEAREKELKANHGTAKVITPLIEFIIQKKAEKMRLKEERREERRKQIEQKKAEVNKKDDKVNKVKQRDRKNKVKGNISVAKNEKRLKEKEKEKEKEKDKEKEKAKGKESQKEKDKDKPPERERKRERNHNKKDRDGDNDKNKHATVATKDPGKENDKDSKKDKNIDKNSYFVVTYSGDKGKDGARKGDSSSGQQSQQPGVSKMDTSQNSEIKTTKKESDTSNDQISPNQSKATAKESKKSDNQRVRNKDRPALEIYRPRRARNQPSNSNGSNSESNDRHSENKPERNMRKTKVYTRSRNTD